METLNLDSTATEITAFMQRLKPAQFKFAVEHFDAKTYGRKLYIAPLIDILNQASKYAK